MSTNTPITMESSRPWQDGLEIYEPYFDTVEIDGKKFPRHLGYRWNKYTREQLDEMKRFAESLMPAPWRNNEEQTQS